MSEVTTAWKGVSKYFVCSALTCYAISLHFGFYSWILYSPEVLVYFFFNVSQLDELPDQSTQLFFLELAIDLFPVGALVGSLLSGYIGDRFGRKGSLVVTNFLSITSVIFLACDTELYVYEFTICAHLLTGVCVGVNLCIMYVYLFEISPRCIRGGVVMLSDSFVKLGNVIAQILTFPSNIGHKNGWYLMVILAAIIPLTLTFLLPRIPESPRYLLIQKQDEETARKVLWRLRVTGDVEQEIEELRQENLSEKEEKKTDIIHLGKISNVTWSHFCMVVIMAGTQLSGFHEFYYNNYKILRSTELTYKTMWLLKIGISFLLCFTSMLAAYLVDHLGRRILFLGGLAICTLSLILMVVVLEILRYQKTSLLNYFCVSLLVIFIAAFCMGPSIISVIISLELFLQSSRASAFAIAGFEYCAANIFLTLMHGKMKKELGSYSLLFFSPFCVAVFIFFYLYIPETKNQTLKDIRKVMEKQKSGKVQVNIDKTRKNLGIIF
ncbi:solute carrier family 2, facilitated glucose transporter member 7-like isoform X1 [Pantherophis guttatus]|uniref:Solute carrier family 2, facilitated glucose transporter member 7-like isoform X1 n=1 Tax=Pantherophis guttatus TaxID=94885 RepID=A0ABM3YNV1_PANGU|nr:solute carrier family 2, facilitated glucose transporter member 7-like isoform X1 [Pantherophis guttatus]